MTLPEVCPLDESQTCKGRECHLFCLEWRTKEPTCLIGYGVTSKIKSGKADHNKDTYAEDTFRKLGRDPLSKRKNVSEKGDWIPSRLIKKSPERHVERKEESVTKSRHFQETTVRKPDLNPEVNHDERPRERYALSDPEKASMRLESRLKIESTEQNSIIYANTQPRVQENSKASEKVISRDKHTTIFVRSDTSKKDNSCLPGREEKAEKSHESREKRRDKAMEIDLPETYDEDFWS